jgi:hypothetical protein
VQLTRINERNGRPHILQDLQETTRLTQRGPLAKVSSSSAYLRQEMSPSDKCRMSSALVAEGAATAVRGPVRSLPLVRAQQRWLVAGSSPISRVSSLHVAGKKRGTRHCDGPNEAAKHYIALVVHLPQLNATIGMRELWTPDSIRRHVERTVNCFLFNSTSERKSMRMLPRPRG